MSKPSDSFARKKQCKACPWRKSTSLSDIPNYDEDRHRGLIHLRDRCDPGSVRIMACHESACGSEYACVGWVANQIGQGGNIELRIELVKRKVNMADFETYGEQFSSLEEMCERT